MTENSEKNQHIVIFTCTLYKLFYFSDYFDQNLTKNEKIINYIAIFGQFYRSNIISLHFDRTSLVVLAK